MPKIALLLTDPPWSIDHDGQDSSSIAIGCYQCALVLNLKKNYGTEFCQLSKTYHVSMVNNIQWSRTWNQNSVHIVHFPNNNSNDGQKTKQCQACSLSRLGRADSPSRSCQLPGRKMSGQTSPNIGLRWWYYLLSLSLTWSLSSVIVIGLRW